MPLRDLLTKKPFTRVMPDGHYDHGERWNDVSEESPVMDYLRRKIATQEDFARELDPCGHLINDREYYPDRWRQNPVDNLWYYEEVPRYAFAYQWIILNNQLTHLTGNDIQFELSEEENDRMLIDAVDKYHCKLAIMTKGTKGAFVYDGYRIYSKAPYNVAAGAIDTTGCGDSWISGFITTYVEIMGRMRAMKAASDDAFITEENMMDVHAHAIEAAMCMGNLKARYTCRIKGAYDWGEPIRA